MEAVAWARVRRLGVLGGSFDPIHFGHLQIAEEAREGCGLDAVLFVPAGAPPHKAPGLATPEQRCRMVELATADNPCFAVSRLEADRPGISYTVDTIRALAETCPDTELHLILGADMALDFPSWRAPLEIRALARLVVVTRPGIETPRLREQLAHPALRDAALLTAPAVAISSTDLRARARSGRSLRYLLPDAVADFIAAQGLYRG